mmetsp:Transcript_90842/g.265944  ORF Transcript_90842/g.265944 Transcript_90842/m.265944 type:complete len:223 (-) Transcript_90842:407-1075(-)
MAGTASCPEVPRESAELREAAIHLQAAGELFGRDGEGLLDTPRHARGRAPVCRGHAGAPPPRLGGVRGEPQPGHHEAAPLPDRLHLLDVLQRPGARRRQRPAPPGCGLAARLRLRPRGLQLRLEPRGGEVVLLLVPAAALAGLADLRLQHALLQLEAAAQFRALGLGLPVDGGRRLLRCGPRGLPGVELPGVHQPPRVQRRRGAFRRGARRQRLLAALRSAA